MEVMVGAYTPYSTSISQDEEKVFKAATKGLLGVDYIPLAVATQVVAGINYKFLCNAKGVYPNAPDEAAIIEIYQPLEADPIINRIIRC